MALNVLIFPAGSEIGLEILNSLKFYKLIHVVGGTSTKDHSSFVYENLIEDIPFIDAPDFIQKFNAALLEYQIDFIYPAHDSVGLFLTQHLDELEAKVITSPLETVEICRSKKKTYEVFSDCEFVPVTFASADDITEYPIFVKPSVGQGSNGATKVHSREELDFLISHGEELVLCEYLQGEEYTIDCFTDKDGVLRVVRKRVRARIKSGISVNSKKQECEPAIYEIAQEMNRRLTFSGAWFFQLKQNAQGEYRLLEISPRIPGTMGLSRNQGINFPLLSIYVAQGMPVDVLPHDYDIEVDRAFINRYFISQTYDTVYLDLDDTLVFQDRVNEWLMLYLYQLVNAGKRIVLLTKHNRDVHQTLSRHKISEKLFDKIIHLDPSEDKYQYVDDKNSIFIDDSFKERKDIRSHCKINVFDLDEVEALIDWKKMNF